MLKAAVGLHSWWGHDEGVENIFSNSSSKSPQGDCHCLGFGRGFISELVSAPEMMSLAGVEGRECRGSHPLSHAGQHWLFQSRSPYDIQLWYGCHDPKLCDQDLLISASFLHGC